MGCPACDMRTLAGMFAMRGLIMLGGRLNCIIIRFGGGPLPDAI
jgi:hypothetical protein